MPDAMMDVSHLSAIEAATCHNDELPDDTKRAVRLLLFKAQLDLTSIDAEIKYTSLVPPALLSHRTRVEELTKSYQVAIAPHRILPNELLREIFMQDALHKLSLPKRKKDSLHPEFAALWHARAEFPLHWYVSHVCAKWRRVVLQMPELWNKISVNYDPKASHSSHVLTTNLATEILKRTWDFESFIFPMINMRDLQPANDHDPISAYLIPNASRLRRLRITASLNVLEPFLTLPAGSVEEMNSFSITFKGHLQYPITVFKGARSLRRVWLSRNGGGVPTVDIFSLHLPWSQLTQLELWKFKISSSTAQDLLQCCSSLEHCRFSCIDQWESPPKPESYILRPRMQWLDTVLIGFANMGHWLGPFLFPCLTHLDIDGPWDSRLVAVITSSHCLSFLTFRIGVPAGDMEDILTQARSLEFLNISGCMHTFSRSTLEILSDGKCVPMLRALSCMVTEDNLDHHFDMLESRRLASCHIERVIWLLHTYDMSYGKEREDKLRSEGYDITITRSEGFAGWF
jgi:hypothetical protein